MSPRVPIALAAALLLHGIFLLLLAPQRPVSNPLPPGAGRGIGAGDSRVEENAEEPPARVRQAAAPESEVLFSAERPQPAPAPKGQTEKPGGGYGGGNSYFGVVRAYLNAHKSALSGDFAARGVAEVRFDVDADGAASTVQLARSSGIKALDLEALALVLRASPLPPPPRRKALRLVVPIEFR